MAETTVDDTVPAAGGAAPDHEQQQQQAAPAMPDGTLLGTAPAGSALPPAAPAGGERPERESEGGKESAARPAYTDFALPEGVTVDGEAMKAASDLFADSGLDQEQAQKFLDLALSREQAAARKSVQAGVQAYADLQNKWVGEVKADPEIGGDRLAASIASAARAIDRLGVPGLKEALDLTGAGNHPAVVKAFVRVGQMVSEDRFAPGNDAAPAAPRTPAEMIYGAGPK